ncbi:PilC/PilY family type IV pilus protein [uncultured Azonexus sp.]|uniref:pilus assembly protein n=1 Tax=uncultured Azonexus sp. TaxID=520307 RepID=UPI00262B2C67|nr:PilC/PilY family type IV pilus protein [uncultured Azonexus sp.]
MQANFRLKTLRVALLMAFPAISVSAVASSPYPALPPAMSTQVTPNIVLYIDTSGSMLQDQNNNWMQTNLCNSNTTAWNSCVDNNTNGYRTAIDSEVSSPNTKMNIAKRVARNLINNNSHLRFGVFSFRDNLTTIGGSERGQAAIMRSPVRDASIATERQALIDAVNVLRGRTATPLAEGLLEISQYYRGGPSLYGLSYGSSNPGWNNSTSRYISPIQYRCQKNFAIVITDGDATDDQNLPGTGRAGGDNNPAISSISYTARNSTGGAVNRSFSVCTSSSATADDGYNVTCPSTFESNGSARVFGDNSNRPSALRDVAMYSNRADFRVGGTDLDGKSFDDSMFSLQNIITYTVGFAVANEVLPSAALVGGGKYYNASNEEQLATSLNSAIASIGDMTSNAGGVATSGDVLASGNKVFQPVFNPKGWFGELRCFNLPTSLGGSSSLGTPCSPNPKAVIPAPSQRIILTNTLTSAGSNTVLLFNTAARDSLSTAQKNALGSTNTERNNVINFLRGDETITGFRRRPNGLLGDIIGGKPVTVSAPSGYSNDASYGTFKSSNANRHMVFVGANDGMLHGFSVANMTEFVGYIPSAVYPRLKVLKEADYGQSAAAQHTFHVNGQLRQADIKTSGGWMTLLVGGLAQGGQGYFALDVTSETQAKQTTAVKWEWTDVITQGKELGYTFGAPLIYNVRASGTTSVPAVIFANGYDNDFDDSATGGQKNDAKSSALYIVRADTGALIRKITLPTGSQGLSAPAGVDFGQDGVLDYVYAGDINGNLWRFDLTSSTPAGFNHTPSPIFVAKDADNNPQPITLRPAVLGVNKKSDGTSLGNLVMFGTGKLLVDSDRNDTRTQSFYAVLDNMAVTPGTIQKNQLLQRTIVATATASGQGMRSGTYRKISTEALDLRSDTNTTKGWYLDFPDSTERLVSSPLLLTDKLLFGTGVPEADEKCVPGGKGWVMGLNPLTGSVTASSTGREYSFIDIKLDGASTEEDKLAFSGGRAFVSGYATDGIPTELSYVSESARTVVPGTSDTGLGDSGSTIAMQEANSMAVYTGNGADGTVTGNPIARPEQSGKGQVIHCVQGQAGCTQDTGLPASSGVRAETTLWREIK